MISAVLLLAIGLMDAVLGLAKGRPGARVGATAVALLVPAAGWLLLGTPPIWAAIVALWGVWWLRAETGFLRGGGYVAFLTVSILTVPLVAVAAIAEGTTIDDSPAARAFARSAGAAELPLSLSLAVAAVAAALILTRSANVVCRAAFGRTRSTDAPVAPPPSRRAWRVAVGSRAIGSVVEDVGAPTAAAAPALRGGRVIGPLERILIVALALVGAQAVIVGLLAAKGIVRFPEISADGRSGSKAEEFLIGSLVSWTIAGLVTAYLVLQRIS